ncbi:GUN4 domain-containing protein [Floridanema evergladense]|uniref:GUN4 domain-containing protein n=1 Tax=Floridaenema evergladense BLCC-F167 TaxID=3153639 RepID=A0ABV4WUI8_9CYAN
MVNQIQEVAAEICDDKDQLSRFLPIMAEGIDYTNLQNLLAAEKWGEADRETARIMLKIAKREEEGRLISEDMRAFPWENLRTIDQLWVKCSNGRFGFSVQQKIWLKIGGKPDYDYKVWKEFADRVGWYVKEKDDWFGNLNFSQNAPIGHLPWSCFLWESCFMEWDECIEEVSFLLFSLLSVLRMKVKEIIKQIEEDGWYLVRTRGSHRQYKHPTKSGLVTIPGKPSDDLAPGTLNSIWKQAQLKQQSENTEHQEETEEESN